MKPTMRKVSLPGLPEFQMLGYAEGHEHQHAVPKKGDGYIHRREFIREYRSWHNDPGEFGFMIVGPTGSGKSTAVLALNSELAIPTRVVKCHRDMTLLELISSMLFVTDPTTQQTVSKVVLGSLAHSFKFGYTVVLEEANTLDPGVAAGMNEIVRGQTLEVEATGEVISRHPMFRFVATGNDWGRGDAAIRLAGLNQQNAAYLNRFWKFQMDYPAPDVELEILTTKQPSIPAQIAEWMVDVASRLREVIVGVAADPERATLDVDFSTRTLLLWADAVRRFAGGAPHPVQYGLKIACLRACSPPEREVIERCARDVMGDEYDGQASP